MELVYLWINNCNNCICHQELNFSPLYRFKVDDKENPSAIEYIYTDNCINIMSEGKISNITAIVGSNGAGKTSLLSYIARNNCFAKPEFREGYDRLDAARYDREKSIYVFFEDGKFYIYHNLEKELKYNSIPKEVHTIHNLHDAARKPMLNSIRKQMIIYLTNSSFVPDSLRQYSKSGNTYNVNLHLHSLYLISNRFYSSLWGIGEHKKLDFDTTGFAKILQLKRNEKTFQEILDVLYYYFLKNNNISNFAGKFKDEISVYFENIVSLSDNIFHDDIEKLRYMETPNYEFDGSPKIELEYGYSQKYFEKRKLFFKKYDPNSLEKASRNNASNVLYFNLLFEVLYYNDNFVLPEMNFEKAIYSQLLMVLKDDIEYSGYLEDIKKADDILFKYNTKENLIDNPDDFACQYDKVINSSIIDFYQFIAEIFTERKSYVLRYIRIRDLEMSAGERAMQNLFSWLVLMPQLDQIMSITRDLPTSKLLLIDEPDLYSHPEWQKMVIKQIIDTINKVETMPVQIVLTSHSPIILSDFSSKNVIYLYSDSEKNRTLVDGDKEHKNTFGANVYSLFNDAFFMESGVVGEWAKSKIYDVYSKFKSSDAIYENRDYYLCFVDLIGDEMIKREMKKLLAKRLE